MKDFTRAPVLSKARNEHRCAYCGDPIPRGEVYTTQKGCRANTFYLYRFHNDCFKVVTEELGGEFVVYGGERPDV